MTWWDYAAPFVGAVALEAVHWYGLREHLRTSKYAALLRSPEYWVVTVAMILIGGFAMLVVNHSHPLDSLSLLVGGAAFPTLLKKLVATFLKQQTLLGEGDGTTVSLRDYFGVS